MNNVKNNIIAVRELLSDPKRWTQGAYARDNRHSAVSPLQQDATCFCLLGAIRKVTGKNGDNSSEVIFLEDIMLKGYNASDFNDGSTHEEMLALLDKAILSLV